MVVVTMDNAILAYTAGLLDGEGHIGIHSSPPKKPYIHRRFNLRVEIVMTHRPTIEWLVSTFGFKLFIRSHGGKRKTSYAAHISSNQVIAFLRLIEPFSITKREQITTALRFYECCQEWNFPGRRLPDSEIKKREAFYLEMRRLNDWARYRLKPS